jgi:hypothetical protein
MPKTIKLEPHLNPKELENRYRKAHNPVLRTHYQILWLISEGKTTSQVTRLWRQPDTPGDGSNSWLAVTTPQMVPRLWEIVATKTQVPETERYSLLSSSRRNSKKEALKKPPPDGGDGGMWNSPKVGEWIERRTGTRCSLRKSRGAGSR